MSRSAAPFVAFACLLLLLPASANAGRRHADGTPCGLVHDAELALDPILLDAAELWVVESGGAAGGGGFNIDLVIGPGLSGNTAAREAFERAAAVWESRISDPITVTITTDLDDIGDESIIGSTLPIKLTTGYETVAGLVVADGADEADDGITAFIPTAEQLVVTLPVGLALTGSMSATKANLKALGVGGLDADPPNGFGPVDANIIFNAAFPFDFDNRDGVTRTLIDFETVAIHEIGHALGFVSAADTADIRVEDGDGSPVSLDVLDLFRFAAIGPGNPSTQGEFTTFARNLLPGSEAVFDDIGDFEVRMSTGFFNGDGNQASHWRDDAITGVTLGNMDPTLNDGKTSPVTAADERAFDLIGYEIGAPASTTTTTVTIPTTTTTMTTTTTTTLPATTTTITIPTTTTTLPSSCPRMCGDATGDDGKINTADALFALNVAVRLKQCALCICDVDSGGAVNTADALRILNFAVSLPVVLTCPPAV